MVCDAPACRHPDGAPRFAAAAAAAGGRGVPLLAEAKRSGLGCCALHLHLCIQTNLRQGADDASFGPDELIRIMDLMNESLTGDEVSEMMAFLDPAGTGRVSYEDFLEVVKKM
jgi:hypothetical protein